MTTVTADETTTTTPSTAATRWVAGLFSAAVVLVVLQGLWAGIFLQHDSDLWVFVHARGAELSILVSGVASVLALWKLRAHRSLWIGGALFTALLVAIAFLGGLITDNDMDALLPVHVPLAMASLLVGTWLVVHTRRLLPRA